MTQQELIRLWIEEHGSIKPAHMSGKIYHDTMFGSEISRCCRSMRKKGELTSRPDGRFEVFYFTGNAPKEILKEADQEFKNKYPDFFQEKQVQPKQGSLI